MIFQKFPAECFINKSQFSGRNGPYYHINTTGHMDQDFVDNEYSAATDEIFYLYDQ